MLLSDIARVTGAKPRSVQLWAEAGIVVPLPGTHREGPGAHRKYSLEEAAIACCIWPFAVEKVAIGGLKALSLATRAELRTPLCQHRLYRAIQGDGENFLKVITHAVADGSAKYRVQFLDENAIRDPALIFEHFWLRTQEPEITPQPTTVRDRPTVEAPSAQTTVSITPLSIAPPTLPTVTVSCGKLNLINLNEALKPLRAYVQS